MLETKNINNEEIELMMTKEYSKKVFGIDYPLLSMPTPDIDSVRYYSKPLIIKGKQYRLCSQWFEVSANNDRPLLLAWLNKYMKNDLEQQREFPFSHQTLNHISNH